MMSSVAQSALAVCVLLLASLFDPCLHAAAYDTYCNSGVYGKPISVQCIGVLASFPIHDTAVRYFVEQQMRSAPPGATWDAFRDPRPPSGKQAIVQLPKWISYGQPSPQRFERIAVLLTDGYRLMQCCALQLRVLRKRQEIRKFRAGVGMVRHIQRRNATGRRLFDPQPRRSGCRKRYDNIAN